MEFVSVLSRFKHLKILEIEPPRSSLGTIFTSWPGFPRTKEGLGMIFNGIPSLDRVCLFYSVWNHRWYARDERVREGEEDYVLESM
jgi:hypothetical protein